MNGSWALAGGSRWWLAWLLGGGAVAATGLWLVVVGTWRRPVRLADVLDRGTWTPTLGAAPVVPEGDGPLDKIGARLAHRTRISERTRATLRMQGRSLGDFMAEKLVLAVIGASTPGLVAVVSWALRLPVGQLPALLVPVGGVLGWFTPNLLIMRTRGQMHGAATEAVFTYIDLVVLERMSNQSSAHALTRAAALSDNVLFGELRRSLEQARLEQRPAWQALVDVGTRLKVPQLLDVADVMRLDEQGAALGATLRARVRELRDGFLMEQKIEAQRISESLTVWMVIPAMVFGLILLTPPLLRMLSG